MKRNKVFNNKDNNNQTTSSKWEFVKNSVQDQEHINMFVYEGLNSVIYIGLLNGAKE